MLHVCQMGRYRSSLPSEGAPNYYPNSFQGPVDDRKHHTAKNSLVSVAMVTLGHAERHVRIHEGFVVETFSPFTPPTLNGFLSLASCFSMSTRLLHKRILLAATWEIVYAVERSFDDRRT